MNRPKNQHFVPRFILRNFLCDKVKEQVAVFDKEKNRVFTTKIDNIMSETKFHDFTLPMGMEVSADGLFAFKSTFSAELLFGRPSCCHAQSQ